MEEIIGVAYVKANGEITRIDLYNGFSPQEGTVIEDLTIHYIENASGINFSEFLNSYVWKDGGWYNAGPKPNGHFFWNGTAWEINAEEFLGLVRNQRDLKLYSCDWTQMPDSPLSAEEKEAWAAYRQALRDFPSTITTETTLEELVWPTAP
jgi:IS1 family transposase